MKILYIANGESIHTIRWLQWFIKRGHKAFLITPEQSHIIDVEKEYVFPFKEKGGYIPRLEYIIKIRRIIKRIRPEILHAHFVMPYGMYGALANYHPFIVSPWGSDIAVNPDKSIFNKIIISYTLKKTDLIHVQDPLCKQRIEELKIEDSKIRVIPWGVDLISFSPEAKSEEWRRKLKKKEGPVIMIIIRGDEKRYANTVARAIPMVLREIPNANFLLIKSKKLKELGLKGVEFIDFIPYSQMPFYMANADIFIDPYFPEKPDEIGHTYGMALLEAMACGTPTIAANRPTISKLKGKNKWYFGYTFEGKNPRDLANKIIKLLYNEEEIKNISKKNRKVVEKKFDWNKQMQQIEDIYAELVK